MDDDTVGWRRGDAYSEENADSVLGERDNDHFGGARPVRP